MVGGRSVRWWEQGGERQVVGRRCLLAVRPVWERGRGAGGGGEEEGGCARANRRLLLVPAQPHTLVTHTHTHTARRSTVDSARQRQKLGAVSWPSARNPSRNALAPVGDDAARNALSPEPMNKRAHTLTIGLPASPRLSAWGAARILTYHSHLV